MRRMMVAAVAAVVLAPGAAGAAESAVEKAAPIAFTNYTEGTTIRYPVPLIRGTLADKGVTAVTVVNESSKRPTRTMEATARKGRFIALAELVPGPNRLVLTAGKASRRLTINYAPQTTPYVVRVFYMTDKTGDTRFQTPIADDPQDYKGKLGTAMLVMQTFTAERMNDLGYGRVTFNLELDRDGRVRVHLLRGEHDRAHYHTQSGHQLWAASARLIRRTMHDPKARNLVIPAFSWFDAKTRKTLAHTALGGGSHAFFGGANIFTWPDRLADVQKAFSDTRRIDTSRFQSDSVGRHTFWGAASTTMGAALHELGHTFGLPHTAHPHDIMTRGHDRLNRVFTLVEPPHARRGSVREFKDSEVAMWQAASAEWLRHTRWFALDAREYDDRNGITIAADEKSGQVRITAPRGIAAIVLGVPGRAVCPVPIDRSRGVPTGVMLNPQTLPESLRGKDLLVRVINMQGLGRSAVIKHSAVAGKPAPPTVPPKKGAKGKGQ